MTEPTADITAEDLAALGTHTGDDAPPPPAPEPEKKPEPTPEPEKKPEPEPEADDSEESEAEFEDMTLDDLDARVKSIIAEATKQPADDTEEFEVDPVVAAERAKTKAAEEKAAAAQAELDKRIEEEEVGKLRHSIASTAGKFKMTPDEIKGVVQYMKANEDLVVGGMGFEEAATRRFPHLNDRLRTSPQPRETPPGEEGSLVAPTATGPGAPRPFKHKAEPGEYGDVTRNILESGEAAKLGRYT